MCSFGYTIIGCEHLSHNVSTKFNKYITSSRSSLRCWPSSVTRGRPWCRRRLSWSRPGKRREMGSSCCLNQKPVTLKTRLHEKGFFCCATCKTVVRPNWKHFWLLSRDNISVVRHKIDYRVNRPWATFRVTRWFCGKNRPKCSPTP
jgi:hypothetical protein